MFGELKKLGRSFHTPLEKAAPHVVMPSSTKWNDAAKSFTAHMITKHGLKIKFNENGRYISESDLIMMVNLFIRDGGDISDLPDCFKEEVLPKIAIQHPEPAVNRSTAVPSAPAAAHAGVAAMSAVQESAPISVSNGNRAVVAAIQGELASGSGRQIDHARASKIYQQLAAMLGDAYDVDPLLGKLFILGVIMLPEKSSIENQSDSVHKIIVSSFLCF